MAPSTDHDYVRILRPFHIISPFSITMASTNSYQKSAMYFAYAILSLVPPTALAWYHVLARENHKYIPFNINGIAFTYWTMNFILNGYLILTLGKQRMQKLIREMKNLDRLLCFSDGALVRKMIVHNTLWLVFIVGFHVSTVVYSVDLLNDSTRIRVLILYVAVDVTMLSEAACFSCFTVLVHSRMRHFVSHLNLLLAGKRRDKGTDVVVCYRQIHRVLRRLEKACQVQTAAVICFSFYSCLRIFLTFIQISSATRNSWWNLLTMTRYLGVLVTLGALGRAVTAQLTVMRRLALLLEHSPDGELQWAGRCMSTEAAVRMCGLRALGVPLGGGLPLRVCAALASAIILLLQLGVNLASD